MVVVASALKIEMKIEKKIEKKIVLNFVQVIVHLKMEAPLEFVAYQIFQPAL